MLSLKSPYMATCAQLSVGHPAVVLGGEDVTTGYLSLRVVSAPRVR